MKTFALGVAFMGVLLVIGSGPADTLASRSGPGAVYAVSAAPEALTEPATAPSSSVPPATLTEVVQQYCVTCHNDQLRTGNLSLQDFSVEDAEERAQTAEKMIRKLRAGMMPPPGVPRPAGDTLLVLVETLESEVDRAAATAPALVERLFQRLSRAEYERVVHDLLALEVEAGKWLPPDLVIESFDNMAAAQSSSTTVLDAYLRAATDISRLAVGNSEAVSSTTKYANPRELSQHAWDRLEGAPFGTPGWHRCEARLSRGRRVRLPVGDPLREWEPEIDRGRGCGYLHRRRADRHLEARVPRQSLGQVRAPFVRPIISVLPSIQTEPIFVRAGQHTVSAAFVNLIEGPYEDRYTPPRVVGRQVR